MKRYSTIFLIAFCLFAHAATAQVDSFSKGGIMYYTYDAAIKPVRNFYPGKVHNTFQITDTACKVKREVIFDPENWLLMGTSMNHCSENPANMHCGFTDSWACINPVAYKKANFKQGEVLQYDGCRLYRNNKLIAPVTHRGFIIHTGINEDRNYTTHNGIATTILFTY